MLELEVDPLPRTPKWQRVFGPQPGEALLQDGGISCFGELGIGVGRVGTVTLSSGQVRSPGTEGPAPDHLHASCMPCVQTHRCDLHKAHQEAIFQAFLTHACLCGLLATGALPAQST